MRMQGREMFFQINLRRRPIIKQLKLDPEKRKHLPYNKSKIASSQIRTCQLPLKIIKKIQTKIKVDHQNL